MDLRVYARVLWRYRGLLAVGVLAAVLAAALSYALDNDQTYEAIEDVYVTQAGFPAGRADAPGGPEDRAGPPFTGEPFADTDRLNDLAAIYTQLVVGDQVGAIVEREGPTEGRVEAEQFLLNDGRQPLPFIRLTAQAGSADGAVETARRRAAALREYVRAEQQRVEVPMRQRIVPITVTAAKTATLVDGRSLALPSVLFLAILVVFVGLALLLDNLRPELRLRAGGWPGIEDLKRVMRAARAKTAAVRRGQRVGHRPD